MALSDDDAPKAAGGEKQGSCVHCSRPDSYDNYVQCDRCNAWWHYLCAGVTNSIADRSFTCEACLHVSLSSRVSSSSSRVAAMQLRLQEMEAQCKLARQELENERLAFETEKKVLQKRNDQLLQREKQRTAEWVDKHTGKLDSADGHPNDRGAAAAINPYQQENEQAGRPALPETSQILPPSMQAAINAAVQAAVQSALQAANPSKTFPSMTDARITGTIPKTAPKNFTSTRIEGNEKGSEPLKGKQVQLPPPEKPQGKPIENQTISSNYNQWIQELSKKFCNTNLGHAMPTTVPFNVGTAPLQPGIPTRSVQHSQQHSAAEWNNMSNLLPDIDVALGAGQNNNNSNNYVQGNGYPGSVNVLGSSGMSANTPTPSQLAARQVMPRDLPPFDGNPADWPIFISSFVNTTVACGYTSAENLARLQRCLKGDAYEAVRSRLLLPDTVPHVLNTLQLLYGRPELLIGALLHKVRSVPAPRAEKLESLIEFGMAVQSLCDHLEAAGQQTHLSNPTLLMELVDKLPAHTKMEWASFLQKCPEVNLQSFGVFMTSIVVSASKVISFTGGSKFVSSDKLKVKQKGYINAHDGDEEEKVREDKVCCVCEESGHRVSECALFKSFSVDGRWKCVQSNGLCRNCLNAHGRRSCRYARTCGVGGCEFRHHPMLHSNRSNRPSNEGTPRGTASNNTHRPPTQSTLFRVIPITLHGPRTSVTTFAFLDDGSSFTLIEEDLVEELGASGSSMPLCLTWTANMTRTESGSMEVQLSVSGTGEKKRMEMVAHTVQNLGLASQTLCYNDLVKKFHHLEGLPIASYKDAVPRLLIGVDNLNLTVPLKMKEGGRDEPVAVKTRLGWCIYGGKGYTSSSNSLNLHVCACASDFELHNIVKDYFAVEDIGTKAGVALDSTEDARARLILQQTTKRVGERYQTGLLWKFDCIEFPDSYNMALKRLQCLERRMDRDADLKENIHQQIVDYQEKAYAKPATQEELSQADPRRIWYLPLGAVVNPKKPGKVRLIWDAAATVDGISLNSLLLKGPDQLASLPAILLRFRQFSVGVSADLKEMFHQIEIREADRHSQRFLWRTDPSEPPTVFLMNVATFGSSCSPASAQFVKNKNAGDFAELYPEAAGAIIHNHYVDDFLDSFENADDALRVSQEVKMIHSRGGFHLRNWLSNEKQVIEGLGEVNQVETKSLFLEKTSNCERVLGMLWNTKDDVLCFSTQIKEEVQELIETNRRPTKRQMLRCVMSFFDPLGLLSAVLIHGRILLQDVWRAGTQWDELVTNDIWERWSKWLGALAMVNNIRIPRCYFQQATLDSYNGLQLHIFVDASEVAYSAVAYFRKLDSVGIPICAIVAAKARVAPLKPLSVPRLELQAAVLGARLMQFVIESHTVVITKRFLWSDSSTVLAWIRSDHRRYKQFVACRIGELLTLTEVEDWKWVPTKMNPADTATKWGKGPCVEADNDWFQGPGFLRQPEEEWPRPRKMQQYAAVEEELRPCYVHREVNFPGTVIDYQRFSKWERLLRTTAYVLRFISNLRLKRNAAMIERGILTRDELQLAQTTLFRSVQWQTYPDEMALLAVNRQSPLTTTSLLHSLSPFLDQEGVLRVDSRIKVADIATTSMKYPIILPRTHRLTQLIIDEYHRRFHHANNETVVNEIRQRYHVSRLRPAVKKVTKDCQLCKINRSKPYIPRMAPLPPSRLAAYVRPFSYVGLDFFGPFLVKVGRSYVKRWIALFTCLTIRAVHVEVVFSLTTKSCIECVRRFICRRGIPKEIYTDNGTNFRGAARLLKEQQQAIREINKNLAGTFTSTTTKWMFIPPAAPHMGGAWERMVRSVKTAMFASYDGNRKLTDEGLQTLITEAETIVNSRPLTYMPLESAECEALTPNHFLLPLGSAGDNLQQYSTDTTVKEQHRQAAATVEATWNATQQHLNTFWKRWIAEYMPTLTKRTKWFGEQKQIEVGDLVFIIDGGTRNEWVRGRVREVVAGSDHRIRQAVVQTARGLLKRPVAKLAILEVKESG